MIRRGVKLIGGSAAVFVLTAATIIGAGPAAARQAHEHKGNAGWPIPPDADAARNPLAVDEKVLTEGRALFKEHCQRCHGPGGLGDGADADPDHREGMNLTNPARAADNPDGVVYHKVFAGRSRPKMPAFRDELTRDQIWSVVAYVQTLRKKP
jgi:mono/diheme cytochrome c family protein